MKAYTYLIGWSKFNKFYYGVRYAKNCKPSDLWNTYQTSSKYVKEFVKLNGDPDIIKVRRVFDSIDKARNWEHKVLRRIRATSRDIFLNKTDNISIDPNLANYYLGKRGELHPAYGKPNKFLSDYNKSALGDKNHFYGKHHSTESKNKIGFLNSLLMWVTDDIVEYKILKTQDIPNGMRRGRLKIKQKRMWINNKNIEKLVENKSDVPNGWATGRLRR